MEFGLEKHRSLHRRVCVGFGFHFPLAFVPGSVPGKCWGLDCNPVTLGFEVLCPSTPSKPVTRKEQPLTGSGVARFADGEIEVTSLPRA